MCIEGERPVEQSGGGLWKDSIVERMEEVEALMNTIHIEMKGLRVVKKEAKERLEITT